MAEYKIPRIPYDPITEEMMLKMDYKSPVEVIRHEMQMRVENDVMKAIQQHDIYVDKNELIKALEYDRDQYVKGFVDGCKSDVEALCEKIKADAITKFAERLKNYYSHIKGSTHACLAVYHIDQIAQEMLKGDSDENNKTDTGI